MGLDVHKDSISIAVVLGGPSLEVRGLGKITHDVPRLKKRLLKLGAPEDLHVAY